MRRERLNEQATDLIFVTVQPQPGREETLPGVVKGRKLQILVDEYPLQRWLRANAKAVLQAVCEADHEVTELRIYTDAYR